MDSVIAMRYHQGLTCSTSDNFFPYPVGVLLAVSPKSRTKAALQFMKLLRMSMTHWVR